MNNLKSKFFGSLISLIFMASIQTGLANAADAAHINDQTIVQNIKMKFSEDPALLQHTIHVKSQNGVVTLSGKVDTNQNADKAIELAQSVTGVTDVDATKLTEKNSQHPLADSAITAKIKGVYMREKLFGDKDISIMGIKVETTDGIVYLGGTVETQQQADNAIALAKTVSGVKAVKSTIEVKPAS